jgi:hypothetical protein
VAPTERGRAHVRERRCYSPWADRSVGAHARACVGAPITAGHLPIAVPPRAAHRRSATTASRRLAPAPSIPRCVAARSANSPRKHPGTRRPPNVRHRGGATQGEAARPRDRGEGLRPKGMEARRRRSGPFPPRDLRQNGGQWRNQPSAERNRRTIGHDLRCRRSRPRVWCAEGEWGATHTHDEDIPLPLPPSRTPSPML